MQSHIGNSSVSTTHPAHLALSAIAHLLVLAALAWYFRAPLTVEIIAAGDGAMGEQNGGAIEVGTISAAQLGLTAPKAVSFVGETNDASNNVVIETKAPAPAPDAEVLPERDKPVKPSEKPTVTERPVAKQSEQLVTKEPLRGASANTNVEVGRSTGSPAPSGNQPSLANGIGLGVANPNAFGGAGAGVGGVPGGSEYGRRIQMILGRNYNPPPGNDAAGQHFVVIQLRIARDGRILSLNGGRVGAAYLKRRSPLEQVNFAAERAVIASNPLPPFPNGFLLNAQEAVAEIWFRYPK